MSSRLPALTALILCLTGCQTKTEKKKIRRKRPERLEAVHIVSKKDQPDTKKFEAPVIDEKEPNDYPNWAQILPPGVGARGFINKARTYTKGLQPDRDVFLFDVPGPGKKILWARLSSVPGINLFLSVYKKSLERIVLQDANGPGEEEIIVNLTLAPGRYFFKLGQRWTSSDFLYNPKRPYTLHWKLSAPSPGEEVEPNNRRADANELPIGRIVRGYLSATNDYDLFSLPKEIGLLRIDYSPPKDTPSNIAIWSAEGKSHIWKTTVAKNTTFVMRRMRPPKGAHFILISPTKGHYNLKNMYKLKISIEPETLGVEEEPNNSIPEANQVTGTSGLFEGYITHPSDKDFVKLSLSANVLGNITLTPFSRGKLTLCLHTHPPTCVSAKQEGERLSFVHQYMKKGEYHLSVGSSGSVDMENTYQLRWSTTPSKPGDEQEPNNKTSKANIITPGLPVKGYISIKGDVDYYRFSLPGHLSNPPKISIQLTGGHGINPVIFLKDSYGNVVMEDSRGVYSGLRKLKTSIHPGRRYIILVRDKSGKQFNPKDHYELRLEKLSK